MRRLLITAALAALAVSSWVQGAAAADIIIERHDGFLSDHEPRACDDPGILDKIAYRFRHQALMVHHDPDLRIANVYDIQERRYLPYEDEDQPIARRYCGGKAELSDGRVRSIWYLIEDGMGLAGIGDNVEFCVAGFDRWMVYNGACRVLR
jgi:hypothetical protein